MRRAQFSQAMQTLISVTPIMLLDAASLSLAMMIAHSLVGIFNPDITYALQRQLYPLLAIAAISFPICRAYAICGLHPSKEFRRITSSIVFSFIMLLLANMMLSVAVLPYEITLVLTAIPIALVLHPIVRLVGRSFLSRADWWGWPVLVVGEGEHGQAVFTHLAKNPILGMRPIRVVGADIAEADSTDQESLQATAELLKSHKAGCVVIALGSENPKKLRAAVDLWSTQVNNLIVVSAESSFPTLWTETHDYGGMLGIHAQAKLLSPWRMFSKRCMDLAIVMLTAPLVLPLGVVIAVLIKWYSPGPIFFGHERIGRDGRKFKAWKFRSMVINADQALEKYLEAHPELREEWEKDHKLRNDPRIIPLVGALIRKLSLDELPQLWNVVRGEMSVVGPRPIVDAEVEKYHDIFPLYLKVTPGITGLWQVSGRNNTTYEERVNFDAYYVRNWSPWLDSYILARTIKTVLLREGAF